VPNRYKSSAGDNCDSLFEVKVIEDLIRRKVSYVHHPDPIPYHRPVLGGFCLVCDSNEVRKGALYQPDLFLVESGRYVELKGGTMTQESRGRLVHLMQSGQELSFLFARDNRLSRGSRTKYSQWAARHKAPWAIGDSIPEEWCR
jgi:hypothetical protein